MAKTRSKRKPVETKQIECPGCGHQITVPIGRDWLSHTQWCNQCGGTASRSS